MKLPTNFIPEFLATFFGVGKIKWAPGTVGTLAAAVIHFSLPASVLEDKLFISIFMTLFFLFGVYISTEAEKTMGHDNGHIVIDEVFGYWLTIIFLPQNIYFTIIGFILFRFFDILKPFPINKLQDLPKGWGVMVDDAVAGIFSAIILLVINAIFFTNHQIIVM